jgi:hypothetical protein
MNGCRRQQRSTQKHDHRTWKLMRRTDKLSAPAIASCCLKFSPPSSLAPVIFPKVSVRRLMLAWFAPLVPNAAAAAYDWDGQGSGDSNNVPALPSCRAFPTDFFLQVWNPGSGWVGNNDGEMGFFRCWTPFLFFIALHLVVIFQLSIPGSTVHNRYDYRDA